MSQKLCSNADDDKKIKNIALYDNDLQDLSYLTLLLYFFMPLQNQHTFGLVLSPLIEYYLPL